MGTRRASLRPCFAGSSGRCRPRRTDAVRPLHPVQHQQHYPGVHPPNRAAAALEYVLRRLYRLADEAGLPRVRVHDLRHFAATTMLSAHVLLAMASKTLRHSTLSTTTEIYGHLLRHVAHQAVDAIESALASAERDMPLPRAPGDHPATTKTPS